ncbi:SDR family oxidoreductase [Nonomuraea sp. SYSU D8015]|uniref:SDR family oxidoreductase n=1 Tax=Nonomuraea sp. SYSU D8015 TaxID=2593644 RepID=UPI001CB73258|nr:SDR family oxidoreductase [Nonomuraea sp. SYSU D8015]
MTRRSPTDAFAGQVVLVTGAAGGIGSAVTSAFSAEGATVAAVDLADAPLRKLATMMPRVVPYAADLTDEASATAMVDAVERELGPITACIHVAGQLVAAPVIKTTARQWRHMFAANTDTTFHVCRAVADAMIPRRRGAIVTVASNAASVPRVELAAYAASKAAAVMFARCLGLELAPYGIRCNIVCPGSTDTGMLAATGQDPASAIAGAPDRWRLGIPLGRIAQPADVAAATLFLASEQARHITMHSLFVDGGASLSA